ncbi:MAG: ABC transporter ATP-binding protein [bacterium]|nr:ABC transporter ATP-binding protein [bacterium]
MNSSADHRPLSANALHKSFDATVALDDFNLEVESGSLLTVLGPSGVGKTTALRILAGFEMPDSGTVRVNGQTVNGPGIFVPPERRQVGMVFQDYALFPHLSVARNVAFGLDARHRERRVSQVLEMVGLAGFEKRMPHELSAGQQQRVALARALAPGPQVILADEPFSNLDAALRKRLRAEVRSILREAQTTAIMVTHDQEEALAVSDQLALMNEGRVVQTGPPDHVYRNPATSWVAEFLGDADFFDANAKGGRITTPFGTFPTTRSGKVKVMVRPESVTVFPHAQGTAVVVYREFFGHDQLLSVKLPGEITLRARCWPQPQLAPGDRVAVSVDGIHIFDEPQTPPPPPENPPPGAPIPQRVVIPR